MKRSETFARNAGVAVIYAIGFVILLLQCRSLFS